MIDAAGFRQFMARRAESIGLRLIKTGHYTAAETLLRKCLAIRRKELPWRVLLGGIDLEETRYESMLGEAILKLGRTDEAEKILLRSATQLLHLGSISVGFSEVVLSIFMPESKKGVEMVQKNRQQLLRDTVERIVQLYQSTNRPEVAQEWLATRRLLEATASTQMEAK